MNSGKFLLLVLVAIFLSGCATKVSVTYITSPSGAEIYSNGIAYGKAPLTLQYDIIEDDRKNGNVKAASISAVWISGASVQTGNQEFDINTSTSWNKTISRPYNFPNRDKDYYFGQQHEQLLLQQRQIAQEQEAENAQLAAGIAGAINRSFAPIQPESTVGKQCYGNANCGQGQKCAKQANTYQGYCIDVYYVNP